MPLTIGTNIGALWASAAITSHQRGAETAMAWLASGKRINSSADDPAGVAITSRMNSEIRSTSQAIRNALDGQALLDTAEGGIRRLKTYCNGFGKSQFRQQMTQIVLKTEIISTRK